MVKSDSNKREAIKYYLVTAKCGHVRKSNYIPITFEVRAANGKEAAAIARRYPRVKHDHVDTIQRVEEVSIKEFLRQKEVNSKDPYLKITSRKDHNKALVLFEHRILPENKHAYTEHNSKISMKTLYSGKEKIRHPRKWLGMYPAA